MQDKVMILTGASAGIGAALARQLAARGTKLALVARNQAQLATVAADCPGAIVIPADISEAAACRGVVEKTLAHFSRLDVLIHNAGLSMLARLDEVQDFEVLERLMAVNYYGPVYLTHAALPHLKASRGLIVGVSSLAGKTGVPLRTGYSASKHAMQGFFDSLRIELADSGVGVSMVSPGFVDTEIRQHSLGPDGQALGRNPLGKKKLMSAEDCAAQIVGVIATRQRELLMGRQGKLLGWGRLLAPGLVDYLARRSAEHR
jgi:short-subunit dehydrogenase